MQDSGLHSMKQNPWVKKCEVQNAMQNKANLNNANKFSGMAGVAIRQAESPCLDVDESFRH